jgi:hypothetical protein
MGAAYFIVLEHKVEGVDTAMDGKSISRNIEELDGAARSLNVRPLSEYFSVDPESVANFFEAEGFEGEKPQLPPLQHFSAQEGLVTVNALLAHPVGQADGVAQDLRDCQRVLASAAQHGVGWHFEVDF